MRIRKAMEAKEVLVEGIVESDETYVGEKRRKGRDKTKRGRGTKKTPVVEGGGRVVTRHIINHKERCVSEDGFVRTNTIEGIWA